MFKDIPSLTAALNKTAELMAEDVNTPMCRCLTVADAGCVLARLKDALDAALDQTITDDEDEIGDLKTRLDTIAKIIRQSVDLSECVF
jgi:hypothetical protein